MNSDSTKESVLARFQNTQAKLSSLLNDRISADMSSAIYLHDDTEVIAVSTVPLCSYGLTSKTTVWAWTNSDIPLPQAYDDSAFRHLAEATGEAAFLSTSPLTLSEEEEKHLLALATEQLQGHGVLSQQHEDTVWYLLATRIQRDSEPAFAEDTIRLGLYWLFSRDRLSGFNQIRARHPNLSLNFSNNDLRGEPQPWKGDLHAQPMIDHDLISEHQLRRLDDINLSLCSLSDSNLRGMSLRGASFAGSNLTNADLSMTDLHGADLSGAFLNGTNFFGANLEGAHFYGAELGRTLLVDVDLAKVEGLEELNHATSSEISFSTMVRSSFDISEKFLRSAGVSMGLLDDLRNGKRFATRYSTCFLSYSTKDAEFAEQLYYALQEAGVRVYWDRTSLTAGEQLDEQLTRAIKEHDMTIAVFSADSVESAWLEREVKIALYYKPGGFTPIRIIDIPVIREFVESKQIKPDIVERYPIMDFSGWRDEAEFERCHDLLLKSIRR